MIRSDLQAGKKKVCVWGLGYTGFSALCGFSAAGVKCVGYDVDPVKLDDVAAGKCPVPFFEVWLRAAGIWLNQEKVTVARTEDSIPWAEVAVHLVCVPTEKNGSPTSVYLSKVLESIEAHAPKAKFIVIVESTLSVSDVDEVLAPFSAKGMRVASAPRRDWFVSPEKNLRTIPRVVGAFDGEVSKEARHVLLTVTDTVHEADDLYQAVLIKTMENTLRQVSIQVANEVSVLYAGKTDVRRMLELAATKWNVELLRPSLGVGGYCIPVAPLYVLKGAEANGTLDKARILTAAVQSMVTHRDEVVRFLSAFKSVAFAGLEYKNDTAIYALSPFVAVANELSKLGVRVGVAPENCTAEWATKLVPKAEIFEFPSGMKKFECVVVSVAHPRYRQLNSADIENVLGKDERQIRMVVDNEAVLGGVFSSVWAKAGVKYLVPGQKGWLTSIAPESPKAEA